jgi:hypothetical protein
LSLGSRGIPPRLVGKRWVNKKGVVLHPFIIGMSTDAFVRSSFTAIGARDLPD